jgi:hypothetical protein
VPTYLVERYAPVAATVQVAATLHDYRVRLLQTTLIPADEIALCLFEAPSRRVLEHALAAGGCSFVRVVEAVVRGPGDSPGGPAESGRPAAARPTPQKAIQGGTR